MPARKPIPYRPRRTEPLRRPARRIIRAGAVLLSPDPVVIERRAPGQSFGLSFTPVP
ncbi:MAG: hypothetical protein IT301_11310 [Dehalococcoidia bacterium]|nr:hypothetical protein [Dehalococcoidia bacterium]